MAKLKSTERPCLGTDDFFVVLGPGGVFGLLGLNTNGTIQKDITHLFELRNTINVFVCIIQIGIIRVTKLLMLEHLLSGGTDAVYWDC